MAHLTALSQQRAVAARAGRPARPRLPAPGVAAALRPRGGARAPRAAETAAAAGTTSGGGPSGGPDGGGGGPVYQGVYGPWRVEREDEVEVLCYRLGLTATAAALCGGAGLGLSGAAPGALDALCALGAAGLGASVFLIHVYVTPLKRFLQVTWAAGVAGGLYLAAAKAGGQPLPLYVADHPWAVWLVGPYFASLTGVAVKEGLCYGRPEAAALAALLPLLLLGHLTQVLPPPALRAVMGGAAGAVGVFAARKYTQAPKDDIGDKSVFEFRKLSPEQQAETIARLRLQQGGGGDGGGM